jgi:hypothetical protein
MENMKIIKGLALLYCWLILAGCETTDTTLRGQGKSDAYIMGFHDGRHSGMQEAGNYLEHYVKDEQRFDSDVKYREGWLAGEAEGIRIQREANGAVGVYSAYEIGKEAGKATDYDKVGKDAVKDVDPSTLEGLEQK